MPLIRRSRPAVVVPPPTPEDRVAERREVNERRAGDRRRLITTNRLSAADIIARAATRPVGPTTTNSSIAKEVVHRAAGLRIDDQLKLIANAEADIDDAQLRLNQAYAEVERELRGANMTMHSNGLYLAEIEETFSRQSLTIDPKKFKAKVGDTTFWKCIKVSVEKAREMLSEREVTEIADVVQSKSTGHRLKVKKLEIRKRTK